MTNLLMEGVHNRHIAEELCIRHRTGELQGARLPVKLARRSVFELMRFAE